MSSQTIYGMPYLRPFQELPPIEEHPDEHKKESTLQKLRRQQSRVDLLYPQPAQLVRTKSVKDPRFFDLIKYLERTQIFTTQIWLDMMRYFENSETIELAHVKTYFQNKNLLSDALDNELTQIFWRTKQWAVAGKRTRTTLSAVLEAWKKPRNKPTSKYEEQTMKTSPMVNTTRNSTIAGHGLMMEKYS